MFRIVICEDENIFSDLLEKFIINIFEEIKQKVEIVKFKSGEELIGNYPKEVDIFLLDIEMDKLNGMDVARKIREVDENVDIIFTTAILGYMQDGYEVSAYRYLLKPIEFENFKKHILSCIQKVKKRKESYIIIQDKNEINRLNIDEIEYIEIYKKQATIYTSTNTYISKTSITSLEKELSKYDFFRCHRSYLVNIKKVQCLKNDIIKVNNTEIPISRYRLNDFKIKLTKVLGDILC